VKGNIEFRIIRNGTRVIAKDRAEISATNLHLDTHKLSDFTFCPQSQKRVEVVVTYLPISTPAEDTCNGLADLGFNVINLKKISAFCQPPAKGKFLVSCNLAQDNEITRNF
jgi:hypothetical protein